MASPYQTFNSNYDVPRGDDTVTVPLAAPVHNNQRVIIDLSQDDSDTDVMPMDVVEIFDSPVLADRSIQNLDVHRYLEQFSIDSNNHPPLPYTPNASANTTTFATAAFVAHHPTQQTATTSTKNNWESSNELRGDSRPGNRHTHRDRAYQHSFATNSPDAHASHSVRFANTERLYNSTHQRRRHHQIRQESIPTHHYSHPQTNYVQTNSNGANHSTASTATGQSRAGGRVHLPNIDGHNPQRNNGSRRNHRRRGYASASVARERNQEAHQHRLFSIVHHLAHEQLLRRQDVTTNNTPHGNNIIGGRLLNLDNLSYEDLLSIFGNGSENCGASVSDISLLPVVTVTEDDVISTETGTDGSRDQEHADMNSNKYCCSVCLDNYQIGEQKKILPCFHTFHEKCIDQWLIQNGSCPICKHRIAGLS